jgi:hypothetical protein
MKRKFSTSKAWVKGTSSLLEVSAPSEVVA